MLAWILSCEIDLRLVVAVTQFLETELDRSEALSMFSFTSFEKVNIVELRVALVLTMHILATPEEDILPTLGPCSQDNTKVHRHSSSAFSNK